MLPENLKAEVQELAAIAQLCPEPLRGKCFELLLTHYLSKIEGPARTQSAVNGGDNVGPPAQKAAPVEDEGTPHQSAATPAIPGSSQQDIVPGDLHIRAKKFLEKCQLTIADLNQLFYKEGEEFRPLYEDLKTTKGSESQTRIALLHALLSGMKSGEFQFDGEAVRSECQTRKCYDAGNFSANFRNNTTLFDAFEKYEKQSPVIKLSDAGREKLAAIIRELR